MVRYMFALFYASFAALQIFATGEDDIASCLDLFKPKNIEQNCCEYMKDMIDDEHAMESCTTNGEWECENAKCALGKAGILSGDTVDEKKTIELLEKIKQKRPESAAMTDRVKAECLDGKYEDYPPKETCPLIRFQICSYLNALVECDKWKQNDACKKFSDNAKTCKTVLDKVKE